jgi:hypothetical protein
MLLPKVVEHTHIIAKRELMVNPGYLGKIYQNIMLFRDPNVVVYWVHWSIVRGPAKDLYGE